MNVLLKIFIRSFLMDYKTTNLNMRFIGTSQAPRKEHMYVSSQPCTCPGRGHQGQATPGNLTVLIWKMGLSHGNTAG